MENERLNELIGEIEKTPNEIIQSEIYPVSRKIDYQRVVRKILFDFYEECRINVLQVGPKECIFHFVDFRKKFEYLYDTYFEADKDGVKKYRSKEDITEELSLAVIQVKENLIVRAILYLTDQITSLKREVNDQDKKREEKQPKEKASYSSFRSNFNDEEDLKECFQIFIDQGFIPPGTNYSDFERIFTGRPPTNKITWLRDIQELRYLIRKINGISIHLLGKQIWNITINCFRTEEGKDYTNQNFHTKDPKYPSKIKLIVDFFHTYSTL